MKPLRSISVELTLAAFGMMTAGLLALLFTGAETLRFLEPHWLSHSSPTPISFHQRLHSEDDQEQPFYLYLKSKTPGALKVMFSGPGESSVSPQDNSLLLLTALFEGQVQEIRLPSRSTMDVFVQGHTLDPDTTIRILDRKSLIGIESQRLFEFVSMIIIGLISSLLVIQNKPVLGNRLTCILLGSITMKCLFFTLREGFATSVISSMPEWYQPVLLLSVSTTCMLASIWVCLNSPLGRVLQTPLRRLIGAWAVVGLGVCSAGPVVVWQYEHWFYMVFALFYLAIVGLTFPYRRISVWARCYWAAGLGICIFGTALLLNETVGQKIAWVDTVCFDIAIVFSFAGPTWAAVRCGQLHLNANRYNLAQTSSEMALRFSQAGQSLRHTMKAYRHDLRQPLQSMTLMLGLEKHLQLHPDRSQRVAQLIAAQSSLKSMLDDLFSTVDAQLSGALSAQSENVSVQTLFEELQLEYTPLAIQKGLLLRVAPTRLVVYIHKADFKQLIRNALDNAIKYTQEGYVLMGVRHQAAQWRVCIMDSGPGLSSSAAQHHKGWGYGTEMMQRLARRMGASVSTFERIRSDGNVKGTTVSLYLKKSRFSAHKEAETDRRLAALHEVCLLAEHRADARSLSTALRQAGIVVHTCRHSGHLVNALTTHPKTRWCLLAIRSNHFLQDHCRADELMRWEMGLKAEFVWVQQPHPSGAGTNRPELTHHVLCNTTDPTQSAGHTDATPDWSIAVEYCKDLLGMHPEGSPSGSDAPEYADAVSASDLGHISA